VRCLAIVLCFASRSWQIALELLHHGCDLNVRICTKHCFFRSTDVPLRRKVGSRARRLRASSLCRPIRLELRAQCNWGFQVTFFFFFVDAVLLCFACVKSLYAVELVHQGNVFYSSLLQFYCVVRFSLCRSQWNGSARLLEGHLFSSKFMAKLYYFIIIPPKSRRFGGMISLTDQRSLCPGWSRATMPCLPKNAMGFSRDLRDNCLLLSPVASGKSKKCLHTSALRFLD
jgi:hypothetical protein